MIPTSTSAPRPALWTKNFILMTLINLFMSAGSFLLIPVLPLYAEEIMGAGKAEIGYIIGIYTLAALFSRPVTGVALDSIGRKSTYLVGLTLFVVMMPFYAWTAVLWLLFVLRFLHGLTWGMITTGGNTIASDIVPMERRGEGIGYFGMSFTVAMALGPVLGLVLIQKISYTSLFYISTGIITFALLLANFVRYPQIVAKSNTPLAKRLSKDMLFEASALPTSFIAMVCSGIFGGLISFITLYMQETGIQTGNPLLDSGAIFFIVYAVGLTIVRPFAGAEMDKRGPARVMVFGFSMIIIGLAGIASSTEIVRFIIASFVTGCGVGVILPTTITMVVNLVEPTRRGVANSTFFSAVDIGVGVGTILIGMLAEATSLSFAYYTCAAVVVIPALHFFGFALKDYHKRINALTERA